MKNMIDAINALFEEQTITNIAIKVGKNDEVLTEYYKSTTQKITDKTLFDMASVTKIISTTQLSLIALDKKLISVDDKVSKFFPCNSSLNIRNLLTHTIGFGYKLLRQEGVTNGNVAQHILSIPPEIPIGSDVRYSCPGFILMGKILEKVFNNKLDILFDNYVAKPLELKLTTYNPTEKINVVNANETDNMKGIVNDGNARFLGGVAGNAGVFSCVSDMEKFCKFLINKGAPLYSEETFLKSVKNHTPKMSESRGLGYLYVDERYKQSGSLFPVGSIGHCGHTGQFVFLDYKTGLYAIILTDATKCGIIKYGTNRYSIVMKMREDLCNAIYKDLYK